MSGLDPTGTRGPLFTDHYQLVMAQMYLREELAERAARFNYFFRSYPDYGSHQAGYCVTAGLGALLEWMAGFAVAPRHLDALRALTGPDGARLFDDAFLEWLGGASFDDIEIHAVPEGRVVHPHVPVLSVTGPLAVAQLLETPLLNFLNYPTLIATKASRIVGSARGGSCLEFGMRRGAGSAVDEGARAAMIAGFDATSNVQASLDMGTTPKGTHAHSMVQAYMALGLGELEAFRAFARSYPDGCVLLVDTIDTLRSGMPNAITVFEELRAAGHEPVGVRLDSGDLAYLGVRAAKMLDDAGFEEASIVLSGELDELTIWQILTQMADDAASEGVDWPRLRDRLVYGVGTRLIVSEGDGALGGVYKLVALRGDDGEEWLPAIKVSDSPQKTPIGGLTTAWRLYDQNDAATADLVTAAGDQPFADRDTEELHHPHRDGVFRRLRQSEVSRVEALHALAFAGGAPVAPPQPVPELAARCADDVAALSAGVRRLVNPHTYHVSLDGSTKATQRELIELARTSTGRQA